MGHRTLPDGTLNAVEVPAARTSPEAAADAGDPPVEEHTQALGGAAPGSATMNVEELIAAIEQAGARAQYSIRRTAQPENQPSDRLVMEPADDGSRRWVVYYSERGQKFDLEHFDDEDAACRFVYADLTAPPEPRHHQTEREREVADVQAELAEQQRRRMMRELGHDPGPDLS